MRRIGLQFGAIAGIIALLVGAFALLAPTATAQHPLGDTKPPGNAPYVASPQDVTIPGSPISVIVRPSGSYAVYRNGIQQFYGAYAEGVYLWVNGQVWGPEQVPAGRTVNPYTQVSSVLTGSGTGADPWKVTNVLNVGSTGLRLTQEVRYVDGQEFIRNDWTLCNTGNTSYTNIHLFHAADLWTDGSDFGYGYYDAPTNAIGGYNQTHTLYQIFIPITPALHYEEDFYSTIWADIGDTTGPGPGFHNTYRTDYIDNGAGLEWSFDLPAGSCVTVSGYLSFSNVIVLPTATDPPSNTPISTSTETATSTPAPTNTPSCGTGGAHTFVAMLSGDQETPPNTSPGTGLGTFTLDAAGTTITYNVSYQGLLSTTIASHLHRGAPGQAGPVIVPLTCCPNPLSGSAPWDPANTSALLAGNVYVNIHSALFPGGEIRGQLIETCATVTPTATVVVPTSTPVTCTSPTPIPVVTPAFTPGPGCSATPHHGDLDATISNNGATTEAVFTNHSTTCSYPIGLASYRRFDNNIDHQELYDYSLAVIPPNSTLVLTVNNPPCAFQADAFYGNLITSFAGGVRYGSRLLDDVNGNGNNYCDHGCPTPQPQPTDTPVEATATPAEATATTTPTGTPSALCAITFSDVPADNPFYAYVRCLVCRGIASGYPDGTFRPGNNVTRGQIAKIVANSANLTDLVSQEQQTFEDVPASSPFWLWIERASKHQLISGYPCGGAGEGCNVVRRPYYRPANNVTRGQLAKIAAGAAGFANPVTSQTFADVPSTSPFYAVVERMAVRGILAGYPCGGAGEGCNAARQPYFRPNNPVTRGQMAKIAAVTFFPDCPYLH